MYILSYCILCFWALSLFINTKCNHIFLDENPFLLAFKQQELLSRFGNGQSNLIYPPLSGLTSSNGLGGLGGLGGGNPFGSGLASFGGSSSPFGSGVAGVGGQRYNLGLEGGLNNMAVPGSLASLSTLNGFTGGSPLGGIGPLGSNLGLSPYGGIVSTGYNSKEPLGSLTYLNNHVWTRNKFTHEW